MIPSMLAKPTCKINEAGQIDQQLDTAYDKVLDVRENIDKFKYLYDLLKNEKRSKVISNTEPDFVITGNHNDTLILSKSTVEITYTIGTTNVTIDGVVDVVTGSYVLVNQNTNKKVKFAVQDGITVLSKSGTVLEIDRLNNVIGFMAVEPNVWLVMNDDTAINIFNQIAEDIKSLVAVEVKSNLTKLGYTRIDDPRKQVVDLTLSVIDSFKNKASIKEVTYAVEKEGQLRAGKVIELNAANRVFANSILEVQTDLKGNNQVLSQVVGRIDDKERGLLATFNISQKALSTAEGYLESTLNLDNYVKNLNNKLEGIATLTQTTSTRLDGTVNSLFEVYGKINDGNTGLEATRIFAQRAQTTADKAIESTTLISNTVSAIDRGLQATTSLAQNTKITVDGLAIANLTINNRVTNQDRNIEAVSFLIQNVSVDAANTARALTDLGVKVNSIDQSLIATANLLQEVKLTADNTVIALNNLTANVEGIEDGLGATANLLQQVKITSDNTATSLTSLAGTVNNNVTGLSATYALAQSAKKTADNAVTSITTLSNTVNNPLTGLSATASLAQSAKLTADNAVSSNTTLSNAVNNPTTGLSATYTLASNAKTTADGAASSITNINTSITNLNSGVSAASNLAQTAKNTADGAVAANNTLSSTVTGINNRLGSAEISLSSTINALGVVSARAEIKTSTVSNGAITVTKLSIGGSEGDIRFQGSGIRFTDQYGNDQMSYDGIRQAWIWGGDMIAGTFQTALSGYRAEMSGKGSIPLWVGSGSKTWANALLAVDSSGNLKIVGNITATSGTLDNVTINNNCNVLGTIYADQIVTPGTNSYSWTGISKSLVISNSASGSITFKTTITITRKTDRNGNYMPFTSHISGFGAVTFSANGYGYDKLNNYTFAVKQIVKLDGTTILDTFVAATQYTGHGGGTINHTAVVPDVIVSSNEAALYYSAATIEIQLIAYHENNFRDTNKGGSIRYLAPKLLCTTYEIKGGISATSE